MVISVDTGSYVDENGNAVSLAAISSVLKTGEKVYIDLGAGEPVEVVQVNFTEVDD